MWTGTRDDDWHAGLRRNPLWPAECCDATQPLPAPHLAGAIIHRALDAHCTGVGCARLHKLRPKTSLADPGESDIFRLWRARLDRVNDRRPPMGSRASRGSWALVLPPGWVRQWRGALQKAA